MGCRALSIWDTTLSATLLLFQYRFSEGLAKMSIYSMRPRALLTSLASGPSAGLNAIYMNPSTFGRHCQPTPSHNGGKNKDSRFNTRPLHPALLLAAASAPNSPIRHIYAQPPTEHSPDCNIYFMMYLTRYALIDN